MSRKNQLKNTGWENITVDQDKKIKRIQTWLYRFNQAAVDKAAKFIEQVRKQIIDNRRKEARQDKNKWFDESLKNTFKLTSSSK